MEPNVAPEDAYKLEAQERAASRMVEVAKRAATKKPTHKLRCFAVSVQPGPWFYLVVSLSTEGRRRSRI